MEETCNKNIFERDRSINFTQTKDLPLKIIIGATPDRTKILVYDKQLDGVLNFTIKQDAETFMTTGTLEFIIDPSNISVEL